MPRTRQIGITEKQSEDLLTIDRMHREDQRRLAYDLREIVDKAFEDLDFIFSEASFRLERDRQRYYPLEAIMPGDRKRLSATVAKLQEWKSNIEIVEQALLKWGLLYMRR